MSNRLLSFGDNMKRKGFISISAILIAGIVLVNSLFIFNIFNLQEHISISSGYKLQSYLLIQDKINRLIYDEENFNIYLKPKIIKNCRGTISSQNIYFKDDYELGENITRTVIKFQEKEGRKYFILNLDTKYRGISRFSEVYGPIVNIIFEIGEPYIFERDLDKKYSEEYCRLMDVIEEDIFDYDCNMTGSMKRINTNGIINIDNEFIRRKDREYGHNKILSDYAGKKILLNIDKKKIDGISRLEIGTEGNKELIKLTGIIYVNGDIVIEQDFDFKGIIILNNGNIIVNSPKTPRVHGMILHRGDVNIDDIDIIGEQKLIYEYGSCLPGFINPKIEVIKKY